MAKGDVFYTKKPAIAGKSNRQFSRLIACMEGYLAIAN